MAQFSTLIPASAWRFRKELPLARWAALLTLLTAEVIGITVRFDTYQRFRGFGWFGVAMGQTRLIGRVAIGSILAALIFGGARVCLDVARQPGTWINRRRSWIPVALHLAAFAGFSAVSVRVLDHDLAPSPSSITWISAWLALGLFTLVFWLAAAFPFDVWGTLVRRAAGSLGIGLACGLLAGGAGQLTDQLWGPLGRSTLWAVHAVLRLFVRDLVYLPASAEIGTTTFAVEISPQCSGYEGIGLIWVFLGIYLWISRHSLKFPLALGLLPLGTILMWCANVARIVTLVLIGSWGAPETAVGGFHSQAGWLVLNAVGLGIVAVTRRYHVFERPARSAANIAEVNPAVPYLLPALVLVGTVMFTAALSSDFDRLYPVRIFTVGFVLWCCRSAYAIKREAVSFTAIGIGIAAFLLWMALEPAATRGGGAGAVARWHQSIPAGWGWAWLAARVFGSVVIVPVAEELAFRGYLTRRLISPNFTEIPLGRFSWVSFVVSSVLFGVLHDRWLAGTLAGLLYALALYRRGNLVDAVVAHATTNALIAAYVLVTGSWSLWI